LDSLLTYAKPNTLSVPYNRPTIPKRESKLHMAISPVVQPLVFCALMVDINTDARMTAPIVMAIMPEIILSAIIISPP